MNVLQFETKQNVPHSFFVWQRWLRMVNRHPQHLTSGDFSKRTVDKVPPTPIRTK